MRFSLLAEEEAGSGEGVPVGEGEEAGIAIEGPGPGRRGLIGVWGRCENRGKGVRLGLRLGRMRKGLCGLSRWFMVRGGPGPRNRRDGFSLGMDNWGYGHSTEYSVHDGCYRRLHVAFSDLWTLTLTPCHLILPDRFVRWQILLY